VKRFDKGNRPGAATGDKNAPQRKRSDVGTTADGAGKPKRRFGETANFERAEAPKKAYPKRARPAGLAAAGTGAAPAKTFSKPFAKRDGPAREGDDRPKRPYTPRGEGGDRPFKPRAASGAGGDRPYKPRGEFGDHPAREGDDRPKRPYTPRGEGGDRPFKPRAASGGGGDRPYKPRGEFGDRPAREGDDRPKRSYTPRGEGGGDRPFKPRAASGAGGDRPYKPRGEFGPRAPREGDDRPKRPYTPRGEGGDRPFKPRGESAFGDKPRRSFEKKPYTPRAPRGEWSPVAADAAPARAPKAPKPQMHDDWIWGTHAVIAALNNTSREAPIRLVATAEAMDKLPDGAPEAELIEREELDRLLPRGAAHQGMAVRYTPLEGVDLYTLTHPTVGILLMLDQVTDPQNVGAIFRSAAAFGVKGIILQDRNAPQLVGGLAKAAVGTIETVPYARVVNLSRALEALRESGWRIVGLDGSGDVTLGDALTGVPTVIVLGSEGDGLRRLVGEHCDVLARIPMSGATESLNVSTATAIALYAAAQAGQSAKS
jgi:23S rRNA (guanosine2251-2'-O)-methyltransferase